MTVEGVDLENKEDFVTKQLDDHMASWEKQLESPSANFERLMEEACKVIMLLMHQASRNNKHYTLDKEKQMALILKDIKGTYNRKDVLVLQIVGGALQIAGGLFNVASVIPAANSDNLTKLASGLNSGGQGVGVLANAFGNNAMQKRVVLESDMKFSERKMGDRDDSERKAKDQLEKALELMKKIDQMKDQSFNSVAQ